jgi:hypothetical protein
MLHVIIAMSRRKLKEVNRKTEKLHPCKVFNKVKMDIGEL